MLQEGNIAMASGITQEGLGGRAWEDEKTEDEYFSNMGIEALCWYLYYLNFRLQNCLQDGEEDVSEHKLGLGLSFRTVYHAESQICPANK